MTQTDRILEARINLYYDLRPGTVSPAPLLIALHGYGANKRYMMREAELMAPEQFAIASLQGFHQHMREPREAGGPMRFGFGWLTNFRTDESQYIIAR
jgi:predicted esterase